MTCPHPIAADASSQTAPNAERQQLAASDPAISSQDRPYGPVPSMSPMPMPGTQDAIANRCKRMTFRSNEVRKRYLAIHNLFASKTCSGDA